jgi:hypothetical protein
MTGIESNPRMELPGASGVTPGFFVPESVYRELIAERDQLRAELAKVRRERNDYYSAIEQLTGNPPFTIDEIEEMKKNPLSVRDLITDIRTDS